MEGFQINYTDLSDLFWEYKRKIDNLIENIDNCIERINMFTENAVFTGKTGDAVKSYLGEAHITILSGIKVTAQTLLDNMAAYKDGYLPLIARRTSNWMKKQYRNSGKNWHQTMRILMSIRAK